MDTKQTGQLIAARRRELGLSQAELAERLHVTDKAVSKWETGRGMPAIDSLEPLAEVLGLSVSELLSGRVLTLEELPETAGGQIVESMRRGHRRLWQGAAAAVACLAVLAGLYLGGHWVTSVAETDLPGLERQAVAYLGRPRRIPAAFDFDTLRIVETERRGDYLPALGTDDNGSWVLCVYDRDPVFRNRWRGGGGKTGMVGGGLYSWNYGSPQREAVIIFCGGELPEEAAYYAFQNSGISYVCPITDHQVLDIFLLPDTADISSYPEELLDAERQPLDWIPPTAALHDD